MRQLEEQLAAKESLMADTEKLVAKKDHPIIADYRRQIETLNRSLTEAKARIRPRMEKRIKSDLLARSEATLGEHGLAWIS